MTVERAMIEQARPAFLAARMQHLLRGEITKGCRPDISASPVALEPCFHPLGARDASRVTAAPHAVYTGSAPGADEYIRLRIWVSPEQPFGWTCAERFLKQLVAVRSRVGFEITGNQAQILLLLLCHPGDFAIVSTAFAGEYECCRLTPLRDDPLVMTRAATALALADLYPLPPYSNLLTRPSELEGSPFASLLAALSSLPESSCGLYQVLFQPVDADHNWHRNVQALVDLDYMSKLLASVPQPQRYAQQAPSGDLRHMAGEVESKAHNDKPFFAAAVRLAVFGDADGERTLQALTTFLQLFQHGGHRLRSVRLTDYEEALSPDRVRAMLAAGLAHRPGFLLNSEELAGLVHVPPTTLFENRTSGFAALDRLPDRPEVLAVGTPIGVCSVTGQDHPVCLPPDLRIRHTHVIGRPAMGKTTMLEEMALHDISTGAGIAVVDPHGDLVDRLLDRIPAEAIPRTIYFDPGDPDWVPLWNPLRCVPGQVAGRVAGDLVAAFKSFVTGWGDRLEHLLRHAFYAAMHLTHGTISDVDNLLRQKSPESERLRAQLEKTLSNRVAREFWRHDFLRYRDSDLGPPHHKLSALIVGDTVPLMFSQPENAFSFRQIMDEGRILLVNLSTIAGDVRSILGCFILSLLHLTALSRSDLPYAQRKPYHLYCDEAHRFMTDALEDFIAETRKFGVSLTLSHQYLSQFTQSKIDALASVGSTVIFNVDTKDARHLVKDLRGLVDVDTLISLRPGDAIVRAGVDICRVHRALRQGPPKGSSREAIIAHSHERYYRRAQDVRDAADAGGPRQSPPVTPLKSEAGGDQEFRFDRF